MHKVVKACTPQSDHRHKECTSMRKNAQERIVPRKVRIMTSRTSNTPNTYNTYNTSRPSNIHIQRIHIQRLGLLGLCCFGLGSSACVSIAAGLEPDRPIHALPEGEKRVSVGVSGQAIVYPLTGVPQDAAVSVRYESQNTDTTADSIDIQAGTGFTGALGLGGIDPMPRLGAAWTRHWNPTADSNFALRFGGSVNGTLLQTNLIPSVGAHLGAYYGLGQATDPIEGYVGANIHAASSLTALLPVGFGSTGSFGKLDGLPAIGNVFVGASSGAIWHATPQFDVKASANITSSVIFPIPSVGADLRLIWRF